MEEKECCPRFDSEPWDEKSFDWAEKRFIKDKVLTLFHIPLNFGGVITRLNKKVEAAGANIPGWLCLSDDTSLFNMDIYLAVDCEVPGAENVTITGKFLSKVYEGPFSDTGKWCNDFKAYAKAQGLEIRKWYMWYTTCPICAKKYGKNYVVVIAQVG